MERTFLTEKMCSHHICVTTSR